MVIVANHPIGSLDGLALIKLISGIRSDLKIIANQVLGNIEQLKNFVIPVDNSSICTLRINPRDIDQHLKKKALSFLCRRSITQ